jgi:lipid-A-disaccharide synthase
VKYYLIAGEASGDLHASNLMKALKANDPLAEFRFWGGDRMQAEGGTLVKHYRELAFMGFTEVLLNLRTILRNLSFCRADLLAHRPDVVILVDYPGFNLRIARFAAKNNIRVFYYIAPQIWAWNQSRVAVIRKTVDKVFSILPFEKDFYARHGYDADYVGHPLLDAIEQMQSNIVTPSEGEKQVVLLPGSRTQEISRMLPVMLEVSRNLPGYRYRIAAAPSLPLDYYQSFLKDYPEVELVFGKTYELLQSAHAALVTSGTATLETALFGVPQAVCYKAGTISYLIARRLVKISWISLVNLIMDKEVVREFIQDRMNTELLTAELKDLCENPTRRTLIKNEYDSLRNRLGEPGASQRTAALMINRLNEVR